MFGLAPVSAGTLELNCAEPKGVYISALEVKKEKWRNPCKNSRHFSKHSRPIKDTVQIFYHVPFALSMVLCRTNQTIN